MHAACAAALQHEPMRNYLVVAQPLSAKGGRGVQLQVHHIPRCHQHIPWPTCRRSNMDCILGPIVVARLQVVYRPGPFDLRAFSQACSKLKGSSEYADADFSSELGAFQAQCHLSSHRNALPFTAYDVAAVSYSTSSLAAQMHMASSTHTKSFHGTAVLRHAGAYPNNLKVSC